MINATNDILMVGLLLVVLWQIAVARSHGNMTTGTIMLLWLYMFRIFDKMFMLRNVFKNFNKAVSESVEMLDILDTPHQVKNNPNAKTLKIAQ